MITGVLIMESLRQGCMFDASGLTFTGIARHDIPDATPDQPSRWTVASFSGDVTDPQELADRFAAVLDSPGWYVDFRSDQTVWVVFPGRVFSYATDDADGRQLAVDYALSVGVPRTQTDWG